MSIDLTDMLRTTDRSENLMPSYLCTLYSDAAIKEGLCENFIDEETNQPWIRLTESGRMAAKNAKNGGETYVSDR